MVKRKHLTSLLHYLFLLLRVRNGGVPQYKFIAFVKRSPNSDFSQVSWDGSPWYDLATPIWPPRSRGETNDIIANSCPSVTSFLFSFVASLVVFDVLESSLNWFFTLIAFDKKGNAVPMQTRVIFFGRAKANYIIAKHE